MMYGQWIGEVELPDAKANAMLCIDADRPNEFMFHILRGKDSFGVLANATMTGGAISLKPFVLFKADENGDLYAPPTLSADEVRQRDDTAISISFDGDGFQGHWSLGDQGGSISLRSPSKERCLEPADCASWTEFQDWAHQIRAKHGAALYRGHGSNTFRLQTTLHRAGRFRLDRYWSETVPQFRDHAETVLGTRFRKEDGDDQATVLGLAQHHGLPTPLLDLTLSPYVAAFFAFSDVVEAQRDPAKHTHVRIYAFTPGFLQTAWRPMVRIPQIDLYLASLTISSRSNPRLYAQQGRFLVTNIAELEGFIRWHETTSGTRSMYAADIPVGLARDALEDLAFMGLTAASMFPGLDGVGKMMRHQMLFSGQSSQHFSEQIKTEALDEKLGIATLNAQEKT